jgi:peptidase E
MREWPPIERWHPRECKVRNVAKRLIMATSGGFIATDRGNTRRPGATFLRTLELTGKDRPKVCFVMTAAGDDSSYLTMSYESLSNYSCDVTHLSLFTQPNADVEERICGADVVWVGGGSVANLLALWTLHGVDHAMRQAWEGGTVLAGVSAGSVCWHVGGTTDSSAQHLSRSQTASRYFRMETVCTTTVKNNADHCCTPWSGMGRCHFHSRRMMELASCTKEQHRWKSSAIFLRQQMDLPLTASKRVAQK